MRTVACCPAERVATQTLGDLHEPRLVLADVTLNASPQHQTHILVVLNTKTVKFRFISNVDFKGYSLFSHVQRIGVFSILTFVYLLIFTILFIWSRDTTTNNNSIGGMIK